MNVHLRGAFLCSRAVTPYMIARASGRIINVCSQLGYIGRAHYTAYAAAKGGVIAFTRASPRSWPPTEFASTGLHQVWSTLASTLCRMRPNKHTLTACPWGGSALRRT